MQCDNLHHYFPSLQQIEKLDSTDVDLTLNHGPDSKASSKRNQIALSCELPVNR